VALGNLLPASPKINPRLLTDRWPASWCGHPGAPRRAPGVFLFRKTLALSTVPSTFLCHVSADTRYRLFVNSVPVAWGPARGDLGHWRFETVDLAPHLRAGKNVLGATVLFYGELMPWAQIGHEAAFLLQGDGDAEQIANTPDGWKVTRDDAYTLFREENVIPESRVLGAFERMDLARHPWAWEVYGFDDHSWADAVRIAGAAPRGMQDADSPWWLVPRPIPQMEETPRPFGRVVRAEGMDAPAAEGFTVPARSRATLLFDHGAETTAFPEVVVASGSAGTTLSLAYAEALVDAQGRKGDRNEVAGRRLRGYRDEWTLDGGEPRFLRPLYWRTFRYAELRVETGDAPVTISGLRAVFTGYPFAEKARFDAPEMPDAKALWDVGWRTARLCAHETYMDCPYYEQLQYAGDTRIQCLVTLYASGDARLFRNALAQLDDSRIADGLTQSRYPSSRPQIIPPFSLWWVGMLHDYWRHVPDPDFVRGLLPGVRAVLDWFRARLRPDGLLGELPWWNFADWAEGWDYGVPPGGRSGGSSILSLQYVLALNEAADLEDALGRKDEAGRLRRDARHTADAVRRHCLDEAAARVADTAERASFSQHAAALAVLAGAVPAGRQKAVVERLLSDASLTQATFYFRFYLNRALVKAGLGDRYLDTLGPWREMRARGLTTWAETPEPTRSDCHAWSAAPNYEFLATVLGVTPDAPGFARVRVAPHAGALAHVAGAVPHPGGGEVAVTLDRKGDGSWAADVSLPDGVTGTFTWQGTKADLRPGKQRLSGRRA
jgi:hypothetical protein